MIFTGPPGAAAISLHAIGKQDTYLLHSDTDESLFNYESQRHSNFTKFHASKNITNPGVPDSHLLKLGWPFSETLKISLEPRNMGDLLSNMYIHLKLPALTAGTQYADQVGRHLIKSITMKADDLLIEKYHDDWGIIYDEMYLDASEKRTKRYTLNRNLAEDTSSLPGNQVFGQFESEVMIPIPFFFSRKYEGDEYSTNKPNRPYLPLCAMHKQKILFEIEFHPQSFFTDDINPVTLGSFDIITEEMTLTSEEQTYLKTKRQLFITDVVKKHPTIETEVGKDSLKIELVPKIPVKTLNWFLRKNDFETDLGNHFNFSANNVYSVENSFYYPVMETAKLYVKGEDLPNVENVDHPYYKYLVPSMSRLSRPNRNIYTYAFSMNPINVEPSGSLDFGQIKSNRTTLDLKLKKGLTDVYTLHMYYVGYQSFIFEDGFMKLAY
jgi:hypothetical protein